MGGKAPKADKRIGEAAMASAATGQEMLDFMKGQAQITNGWALEDRERYQTVFQPLQDKYISDAATWDAPERQAAAADAARASVSSNMNRQRQAGERQLQSFGVDPTSGRYADFTRRANTDTALASAGAENLARRDVRSTAETMRGNAINMGNGLAVNPAQSMSLSNGAVQAGGSAALQGYGQQGQLLNTEYQQRLQAHEANQGIWGAIGGAAGKLLGSGVLMGLSSEDYKEDFEEFDALGAVRAMPVESWKYKDGIADGGKHVGPVAEDFKKATGLGDGTKIDLMSEIGVTMGAVRQLDKKITSLEKTLKRAA